MMTDGIATRRPMHRYDLFTLELFIAVVEEQSIAAAAERAHIAASAISRRISELEAMLGAELLVRHSKGIDLTRLARPSSITPAPSRAASR